MSVPEQLQPYSWRHMLYDFETGDRIIFSLNRRQIIEVVLMGSIDIHTLILHWEVGLLFNEGLESPIVSSDVENPHMRTQKLYQWFSIIRHNLDFQDRLRNLLLDKIFRLVDERPINIHPHQLSLRLICSSQTLMFAEDRRKLHLLYDWRITSP